MFGGVPPSPSQQVEPCMFTTSAGQLTMLSSTCSHTHILPPIIQGVDKLTDNTDQHLLTLQGKDLNLLFTPCAHFHFLSLLELLQFVAQMVCDIVQGFLELLFLSLQLSY